MLNPTLSQLRDFTHLINKGLLNHIRNKKYQPQQNDFTLLEEIGQMAAQLQAVTLAVTDTLKRRQRGEPEVDEVRG
jgi:hypothetical protein